MFIFLLCINILVKPFKIGNRVDALMQTKNIINVISAIFIDSKTLQIQFNIEWSMEDAENLTQKLLDLTSMQIIDITKGADLQSTRLKFDNAEILLNFEEYSHSCWLECLSDTDCQKLSIVEKILNNPVIV